MIDQGVITYFDGSGNAIRINSTVVPDPDRTVIGVDVKHVFDIRAFTHFKIKKYAEKKDPEHGFQPVTIIHYQISTNPSLFIQIPTNHFFVDLFYF